MLFHVQSFASVERASVVFFFSEQAEQGRKGKVIFREEGRDLGEYEIGLVRSDYVMSGDDPSLVRIAIRTRHQPTPITTDLLSSFRLHSLVSLSLLSF